MALHLQPSRTNKSKIKAPRCRVFCPYFFLSWKQQTRVVEEELSGDQIEAEVAKLFQHFSVAP